MLSLAQSPSLPAGTRSPTACTMAPENAVLPSVVKPERFIGLDIHKAYLVAAGVDAEQHQLLPFQRVEWKQFGPWLRRTLTSRDALVVEMTTNTWEVYDALVEHVQSVTVVHPPHVALITRAHDRQARGPGAGAVARRRAAGRYLGAAAGGA